jgi:VWFA-related protein
VQVPQTGTLRVQVSLVTVGVRVMDSRARTVPNLSVRDFMLYEDGVVQQIAQFSSEEQPISLGILLDRSTSMAEGDKLARAKAAAQLLVDMAYRGTEYLYVPFDHFWSGTFTQDAKAVNRWIVSTSIGGGTSLYDAILYALERCSGAKHGRQALVVITDGADQHSSHTLDNVIRGLQESQVQLFAIGYFSHDEDKIFQKSGAKIRLAELQPLPGATVDSVRYLEIDNPLYVFRRLANESGAEAFFPRSDKALQSAAEQIAKDLSTQYTLAYYPSNPAPDNRYRRIKVGVRPPGLKVRAREGYILRPANE